MLNKWLSAIIHSPTCLYIYIYTYIHKCHYTFSHTKPLIFGCAKPDKSCVRRLPTVHSADSLSDLGLLTAPRYLSQELLPRGLTTFPLRPAGPHRPTQLEHSNIVRGKPFSTTNVPLPSLADPSSSSWCRGRPSWWQA